LFVLDFGQLFFEKNLKLKKKKKSTFDLYDSAANVLYFCEIGIEGL